MSGGHGAPWSQFEISIVRKMHMDGASDAMIGRELGRKADGVRYCREKFSITRNPNRLRQVTTPFEDGYQASLWHLIDLMREYGQEGGTLAEAKAEYRSRHEYDVPPAYAPITSVAPWTADRSLTGSHFADVPR